MKPQENAALTWEGNTLNFRELQQAHGRSMKKDTVLGEDFSISQTFEKVLNFTYIVYVFAKLFS